MNESFELKGLKTRPFLFYIKKNKRSFALGISALLITNGLDSVYPLILKKGIDQISNQASLSEIKETALLFFALMCGLALTRFLWRIFFGRYHTEAADDLRQKIYKQLTEMGPSFFKRNQVGDLLSILVSDVQSFRQAIGPGVLIFLDGVIIISFIFPTMIYLNFSWTWKTLILLPLVPFLIKKVTNMIFTAGKAQQDKLGELFGVSQEIVSGIRVIKSFANEKLRLDNYNKFSLDYEKACNLVAKWEAFFVPVMEFGVASGSVILLFIAGPDVVNGHATIGTFVAFQQYITKMVWPMTALGLGLSQFQKGMAAFSRIKKLLDEETDIPDTGTETIQEFNTLEVKNLNFKYPDGNEYALENINFKITKGEFVGIVGPVGSGKTTLTHLLTRLYPATPTSILYNNIPIENLAQNCLHKKIVMVPQEAFLFSESINENLVFGLDEASFDSQKVQAWAQAVDIDNEVKALPSGFDSQLGERGVNLSGGQKQRLTIARALITNAPVVILDDSLSAVDVKTEQKINLALKNIDSKKTLIVVAHRLSSIEKADQIIVLKDGRIESIGSHQELLKTSATYSSMARIQGYNI